MIKVTLLPFMNPYAYHSGQMASDFQIDMLFHGLANLPGVIVQQLPPNPLMFKDCDVGEKKKVWGKGFTLYGLIDPIISGEHFPIEETDLFIVGLHHTAHEEKLALHDFCLSIVKAFNTKTICIDGHDFTDFLPETAKLIPYFKRELLDERTDGIPIFFAIPEEKITDNITPKIYDFSPMVPANYNWNHDHVKSYIYNTEEEYYQQYQQSYFAYSCKKGGWATGRQNEIIANGCIPYITDIEACPKNCLFRYPKELCMEAKRLPGVLPGTIKEFNLNITTFIGDTRQIKLGEERGRIDWDKFNVGRYEGLLAEFQTHLRQMLTTKALAKYVLEKSL